MAEVKWIKIVTDIFDDEKIILIESMPDKYATITCWFKLLCLAGKQNNHGVLMMNDRIAYTDEMIATIFRMPLSTVRYSLDTFEQFGMIEIIDGVITIPNWEKHQSLEEMEKIKAQTRKRVAEYRAKQKEFLPCNVTVTQDVTQCNATDKDIDKDIDIDIDNNISSANATEKKHKYGSCNNVLLKDSEYQKLKEDYPDRYQNMIDKLSEGLELKGYVYKSHYRAILNWDKDDKEKYKKQERVNLNDNNNRC